MFRGKDHATSPWSVLRDREHGWFGTDHEVLKTKTYLPRSLNTYPSDNTPTLQTQKIIISSSDPSVGNIRQDILESVIDIDILEIQIEYQNPVTYADLLIDLSFGSNFPRLEDTEPSSFDHSTRFTVKGDNVLDTVSRRVFTERTTPYIPFRERKFRQSNFDIRLENVDGTNPILGYRIVMRLYYNKI